MRNIFFFLIGLLGTLIVGFLASRTAAAAPAPECDVRLTVELTPDVPDPGNAEFLSSLLSNHPAYRLDLLRVIDPALVELDLSGPGPGYLCADVINTMRSDGRVLSVRIDADETPTPTVMAQRPAEVRVSRAGLGSLYWAARHPSEAWRVVLPVRSGERLGNNVLRDSVNSSAPYGVVPSRY
jgi:hypothetical protein